MTKTKDNPPVVTLEQLEAEIAQHDGAITDLTAARDTILNREKRERLAELEQQLEDAIKGKDGAYAKREKARDATQKAHEKWQAEIKKEQQAVQDLSMAELALRQVRGDIDKITSQLQSG